MACCLGSLGQFADNPAGEVAATRLCIGILCLYGYPAEALPHRSRLVGSTLMYEAPTVNGSISHTLPGHDICLVHRTKGRKPTKCQHGHVCAAQYEHSPRAIFFVVVLH
jgi:hypothetical protein